MQELFDLTAVQLTLLIAASLAAAVISMFAIRYAKGMGKYLCEDCRFNNPTDCHKSERPKAVVCTSYRQKVKTRPHA